MDIMKFSSTGEIIVNVLNDSLSEDLTGPILSGNSWTHIVNTYSPINGYKLYVNGTLRNSTNSTTSLVFDDITILTLGNTLQGNLGYSCSTPTTVQNVYYGCFDEFRVYSRELNLTDINKLINS